MPEPYPGLTPPTIRRQIEMARELLRNEGWEGPSFNIAVDFHLAVCIRLLDEADGSRSGAELPNGSTTTWRLVRDSPPESA